MKKWLFVFVIAIVSFFIVGCDINPFHFTERGEKVETFAYEKDDAKMLDAEVDIGVGELYLSGGADEWVTGQLEYSKKSVKVKHDYELKGDLGKFYIEQEESFFKGGGERKNFWDIKMTDEIPINLTIDAGISDAKLDLRDVQLSSFTFDGGVGKAEIDLSGKYLESFDATISTGVGEVIVVLPADDIGVKVTSSTAIGNTNFEGFLSLGNNEYVNSVYDTADVLIHIQVETGIGDTTFKLK